MMRIRRATTQLVDRSTRFGPYPVLYSPRPSVRPCFRDSLNFCRDEESFPAIAIGGEIRGVSTPPFVKI